MITLISKLWEEHEIVTLPNIQKTALPAPDSHKRGNEAAPIAAYCWLGVSSLPDKHIGKVK